MERFQQEFDESLGSSVVEALPPSDVAYKGVLEQLDVLRNDAAYRARFYGEMGVVRTELTQGYEVNGHTVFYKDERAQPSGSYKSRGATHAVMQHPDAEAVASESTGNHALSVALAGQKAGLEVAIFGVKGMSSVKADKVVATKAHLYQADSFAEAGRLASAAAEGPGNVVHVPPFGGPEVVAGQCTLGDEMVEDLIALGLANELVIIPIAIAGGGHATGVAGPIWEAKRDGRLGKNIMVVGVQPEGTDTMNRGLQKLRAGEAAANLYPDQALDKDCDALAIDETSLYADTMAIVNDNEFVLGLHTVTKLSIARAMDALEAELGGTVEPAAALGRAFVEQYADFFSDLPDVHFVLPISGGNKSPETAARYRRVEREATQHEFFAWSAATCAEVVEFSHPNKVHELGTACLSAVVPRTYTPSPYKG